MNTLFVNNAIAVPLAEIEFTFARSGGPGGQNVNKVNSKAQMRWRVTETESLPGDVQERFISKFAKRINNEGDLIIASQEHRDQASNVDACLEKLREMLTEVAVAPEPRRATKPSRAAKRRRVESKRIRSVTKQLRRNPLSD